MKAEIVPTTEVPSRSTRWVALRQLLKVLQPKHKLKIEMERAEDYEKYRSALYKSARTLGIKIVIRRNASLKLEVFKRQEGV